jgi:hypothetical protein
VLSILKKGNKNKINVGKTTFNIFNVLNVQVSRQNFLTNMFKENAN